MQENDSNKKELHSIKKTFIIFLSIGLVCGILLGIIVFKNDMDYYIDKEGFGHEHGIHCYKDKYIEDYYNEDGEPEWYKIDCLVYNDAFSYAISNGGALSLSSSCIAGSMVLFGLFILIRRFKKKQKEEEKKFNNTTNILD